MLFKSKLLYIPRTAFKNIRLGARKWNGPRAGLTLQRFRRNERNLILFLKIKLKKNDKINMMNWHVHKDNEKVKFQELNGVVFIASLCSNNVGKLKIITMNILMKISQFQIITYRKKCPDNCRSSHLTIVTLVPLKICLETIEASLPRRWPRPSITIDCNKKRLRLKLNFLVIFH